MREKTIVDSRLIPALKVLSDPEYQQRHWKPKNEYPAWDCYTEGVIEFQEISELLIDEMDEYGIRYMNDVNFSALCELSELINEFRPQGVEVVNPELLLQNPQWTLIVSKSKQLLQSIEKEISGNENSSTNR